MVKRIRHVSARAGEWIRVHRHRSHDNKPESPSVLAWLLAGLGLLVAGWLSCLAIIAAARWLLANWQAFGIGLLVVACAVFITRWRKAA